MARKDYTPEQTIGMLREAEVRLSQGERIGKICLARLESFRLSRCPGGAGGLRVPARPQSPVVLPVLRISQDRLGIDRDRPAAAGDCCHDCTVSTEGHIGSGSARAVRRLGIVCDRALLCAVAAELGSFHRDVYQICK